MSYVMGCVIPVPIANRDRYLAQAKKMSAWFKKKGALRVVDCWGVDVPEGENTSLWMAVNAKPGEVIVLSWIEWPSREVHDSAIKAMSEAPGMDDLPFDGSRMVYGSFETMLDE